MDTSERIKKRRLELGLTQEELAQKLGLKKSAIAKYESGRVENIKRSVLMKMSSILDCSPAWLLGMSVPMEGLPSEGIAEKMTAVYKDASLQNLIDIYVNLDDEHKKALITYALFLSQNE